MTRVFCAGECEAVKAGVHGALGALALVCLAYNGIAFVQRRQRHLGINVLVYGALVAYEARRTWDHRIQGKAHGG